MTRKSNRQAGGRKPRKLLKTDPANKKEYRDYLKPERFADPASSDSWPADPGPPETQRQARKSYLRATANLKPEVLHALHKDVFPSFISIYQSGHELLSGKVLTDFNATLASWHFLNNAGYPRDDPEWLRRQLGRIGNVRLAASDFPSGEVANHILDGLAQLEYKLTIWTRHWWWFRRCEWWYDYALQTLAKWHRDGIGNSLDWLYDLEYVRPSLSVFSPFVLGYHAFTPDREPWREYKRRLSAEFEEAANKYRRRIEAQWTSGPGEKLRLASKRNDTHFKMLVDFHFNNKKPEALFDEYHYERSTISEVLRAACNQLPIRYKR